MWYNKYMEKTKREERQLCPVCQSEEGQMKYGKNRSGTQRIKCRKCDTTYTLNPKSRAYPEEIREQAIKTYYSGVSGRGVGSLFGMGKENVVRWIKKRSNC